MLRETEKVTCAKCLESRIVKRTCVNELGWFRYLAMDDRYVWYCRACVQKLLRKDEEGVEEASAAISNAADDVADAICMRDGLSEISNALEGFAVKILAAGAKQEK